MTNVRRIMLAVGTAAALLASTASADSTTSPGKEAAYSSVDDVAVSSSFGTMTSVTIQKGKKKRVLQVTIIAEANPSLLAVGVRPRVNGQYVMEPMVGSITAVAVTTSCPPTAPNCTVVGKWWLDLEQAEAAFPGQFINQPLNIEATIATGTGSPIGSVSLQARLLKK
jgi:hypothetical protein